MEGWRKVPKRDGERIMRGCTGEDIPKRTVGSSRGKVWMKIPIRGTVKLWRCALSAGVAGVRKRGHLGIYYKSTTCIKPLCVECRGFGSKGTGTEDSSELGGAPSCQMMLTRG